jgi:hypothetical protein
MFINRILPLASMLNGGSAVELASDVAPSLSRSPSVFSRRCARRKERRGRPARNRPPWLHQSGEVIISVRALDRTGTLWHYIAPGKPTQNALRREFHR